MEYFRETERFLESMESHLPWLVAHGTWAWIVALVATLAAVPLHIWLHRRRVATDARRAAAEELGSPVPPDNWHPDQVTTAEGIVRVVDGPCDTRSGPAAAVARRAHAADAEDRRAGSLVLVCDGDDHALEGATRLLCGSRWTLERRARSMAEGALTQGAYYNAVETVVASGDRVRVRARVEAVAGGDSGYREAARQWRLVGTDEQPIDVVADQVRVPVPAFRELPGRLILALALFMLLAAIAGALGKKSPGEISAPGGELDIPLGFLIASATPFHRDDALRSMSDSIDNDSPGNRTLAEAEVEIELLREDCPRAVDVALSHHRFRLALDIAESCPASPAGDKARAKVHHALGNLSEVSDLLHRFRIKMPDERWSDDESYPEIEWRDAIRLHLLAGRPARAAEVIERAAPMLAARIEAAKNDGDPETDAESPQITADVYACMALAMRVRAGESESLAELRATATRIPECQLLLADATPPGEREALLIDDTQERRWRVLASWNAVRMSNMLRVESTGRWGREPFLWMSGRLADLESLVLIDHLQLNYEVGVIESALASFDQASTATEFYIRARLGAELAFQRASWQRGDSARLAEQATRDIQRAGPLNAISDDSWVDLRYQVADTHYTTLLLRAALEARAGDTDRAKELREAAITVFNDFMKSRDYSETEQKERLEQYFGAEGFVPPGTLIGPFSPEQRLEVLYSSNGYYRTTSRDPEALRFAANFRVHPGNIRSMLASLLRARELARFSGGAAWQEELDQALENWWRAWSRRDSSVLLAVLDDM